MVTILLDGLEFYAFHGVPEAEREIGHRYRVDLEIQLSSYPGKVDNLQETIEYGTVGKTITHLATTHQFQTVERLGHFLCGQIFSEYPNAERVSLSVRKLLPPAPIIAEAAGIRIQISRTEYAEGK